VFAFASVLLLFADLDRPTEGSLTASQEAMIDLQRGMRAGQPWGTDGRMLAAAQKNVRVSSPGW
jgi:hypothetical protein